MQDAMLVRLLALACALATSGILPSLAWARPADPCLDGGATHATHDEHEDETCADDCRAACQCPCCPVRVSLPATVPAAPRAAPAPRAFAHAPKDRLRAGVKGEVFHPPSR